MAQWWQAAPVWTPRRKTRREGAGALHAQQRHGTRWRKRLQLSESMGLLLAGSSSLGLLMQQGMRQLGHEHISAVAAEQGEEVDSEDSCWAVVADTSDKKRCMNSAVQQVGQRNS